MNVDKDNVTKVLTKLEVETTLLELGCIGIRTLVKKTG